MPSQQRSIVRRAWVATGLVLLCLVPVDPPRAEAQATTGSWQLEPNLPFFPIHDHVLPDGKVMMWPGDQGINGDDPRTWDPATGTVTTLPKAGFDIFCSGHSFLPDGRLFVAGGHISNGVGLANTSIYSPAANSWQSQPLMNQGRWYPTTTVLSNGDVLVVSGSVDGTIGSKPVPQVWQASSGTWRNLNSANLQQPLYPYMFLAPDGRVFDAGPGVTTRLLDTAGAGTWSVVGNHRLNASREYGSAVMYEPGKILLAGGGDPPTATAEVIDLNVPGPTWQTTGSMNRARRQMNLTMLPDGKVLGTGGTSGPGFNDPGAPAFMAEMWDPATGRWTDLVAAGVPRLYHSIALLLPDGRVLTTGGNGYTQSEIYSPPYLFAEARPSISSVPASVGRGQSLVISTPDATTINAVAWVRLPSVTHTNGMSQGFFRTTAISQVTGGIQVTAPNHTSVPSGHYMLFVLRNGVPSDAKIVNLGTAGAPSPVPTLTSMTPTSATAGSPPFTLTVNGSNFVATSKVRWNGAERTTTFVSGTELRAAIPAADIAAAGTVQVTVASPAPGGGVSGALPFTVSTGTGSNPVPTVTGVAPGTVTAGGPAFTLTVTGNNFVNASRVRWNGVDRTTTVVSATQLTAAIPAGDIVAGGAAQVTVFNPSPGGGTSPTRGVAVDVDVSRDGTPIARVTAPTGGGARSLDVIRDGTRPPVGSADSALQYDTYDGPNTVAEDWIGYQFGSNQTFRRVLFQEGKNFVDGGWFTTLRVQVRQGGNWINVPGLTITPSYPGTNNGTNYETYDLQFTPTSGDGIRIIGNPGGSVDFISVGELRAYASTTPGRNLTALGSPTARVMAPTGGGSRNLEVLRDGVTPAVGSTDTAQQYDTYDGPNTVAEDWIGYQGGGSQSFNRVLFQEGRNFVDGGWFTTLRVQVRQGSTWVNVPGLTITPAYPGTNNNTNYESYNLRFTATSGDGIRIIGNPGGSADFISVGEMQVYGP